MSPSKDRRAVRAQRRRRLDANPHPPMPPLGEWDTAEGLALGTLVAPAGPVIMDIHNRAYNAYIRRRWGVNRPNSNYTFGFIDEVGHTINPREFRRGRQSLSHVGDEVPVPQRTVPVRGRTLNREVVPTLRRGQVDPRLGGTTKGARRARAARRGVDAAREAARWIRLFF